MIEIQSNEKERAILVGVKTRDISREIAREHLDELEELAYTAGAETLFKIIQERSNLDSAYYIGKGKAEEIAQLVELNEINLIIFDDDLSLVQTRNLEKMFDKKVLDRSGLILDIFASRARTNEAKTQVELAQLEYMLPRLTRAWTHLSKQYGGIGTKGPGETQIETDRRLIRDRISLLKKKLEKIEESRETQTQRRKEITTTALVGYTNAGKSTLFNLLTATNNLAEDKLFATLDSTTRTLELPDKRNILISDTVGFIRKLPPHLVASFKSTLNEVRDADILLHVIDMTHPYYEEHIQVVENTLKELECSEKPLIKVFNKVDAVKDKTLIEYVSHKYEQSVVISAARGIHIESLLNEISSIIDEQYKEEELQLHAAESKLVAQIHTLAHVISTTYDEDQIYIKYRATKKNSEKIKSFVHG